MKNMRPIRTLARRVTEILNDTRAITVDTALRLARYFGTTPEFWLNISSRMTCAEHAGLS